MGDSHLACWDSHMRVYQEVVDNPAIETALILEDDIDFDWNIEAKVARARAAIGDRPWDAFYLGHCGDSVGELRFAVDLKANLYHGDTSACTHGYAVSKQGLQTSYFFIKGRSYAHYNQYHWTPYPYIFKRVFS
ncbi:hypothetical protein BJ085DRAFT_30440 [Dimargaris cristalligena]|uniref:Glycosyl transferase family 25 domain-containing protein n=1 Tax=Dimargaris cristalligena TaxID=215637 RepID=A0A4P9ZP17_9FUNG|nr:hypothetical protein BJ085DRAFT_30440 [Dimargaris cristalligena]|eukprot:RKP34090.1 hypothetical protein BJ085DRAFT_30440 [Dimargaris cristalligena]